MNDKQPPREQPEGDFPPRLRGRESVVSPGKWIATESLSAGQEYLSLTEHQAALQSAVAEARAKAFSKAWEITGNAEILKLLKDAEKCEVCGYLVAECGKVNCFSMKSRPSQGPEGSAE